MRKFIFALLVSLIVLIQNNQAQIVVKIANVEVAPGTPTATVDFTVDGFTNLVGAQFSINYDSLVLSVNSVSNLNTTLNLSPVPGNNFNFPGTGTTKKGQLTFSWSDGNLAAKTLPNGTRMFSVVFNVLGGVGTRSDVSMTSTPLTIEFINANFTVNPNVTSVKGSVKVMGTNPNPTDPCPDVPCQNPGNLSFAGDTIKAKTGSNVKVPFRVKNFKFIEGGQGTFSWDTLQLKFVSVNSTLLTGSGLSIQFPNAIPNGQIRYSYFNTGSIPLTAPDNSVVFEITFQVLSACVDTARVCMGKLPVPEMDWAVDMGGTIVSVPFCVKAGTVLITCDDPPPPVKLKLNTAMGNKGSTVCLDVRVDDFDNIRNMQFSFTWNPAVLKYVSTGMYDLKGLSQASFSNNNQTSVNLSWNTGDNSVVSVPDNHKIFQICFELIGDCDTKSAVQIVGTPLAIEVVGISGNNNDFEFDTEITNGEISIKCPTTGTCTINSVTNVSCFGGNNGAVSATVTPASGSTNCMCVWKNSQGVIIKSSANLSDCNLANVASGSYTLELICNSQSQCTSQANVGQADRINIPATGVTNVSCSGKGAINVTGITGGTQPFNVYTWDPNVGNTSNLTNLDAGTYRLTVTDIRGCTGTQTYVITDTRTEMTATATHTDVSCFGGNNGTITVSPSGGCPPYNITGAVMNLSAGNYTVTITDSTTPANVATVSVTISQPSAVTVDSTIVDANEGQNNGSITLIPGGGTGPYNITWQSTATQIAPNTNPATNLSPGTYNVTVSDANNCTLVVSNLVVKEISGPAVKPVLQTVGVTSNYNGFGVDCNGNCTGVISGTLAGGTLPVKLIIKRGTLVVEEINLTANGNFVFDALCAGSYTVDAVNVAGTTTVANIVMTTPTRLIAGTPTIECTEPGLETGSITIDVNNSGTAPYTYNWSTGLSTTNVHEDLGTGIYGVTVTDANNCKITLNNLDILDCGTQPGPCGVGTLVLTPDGNGQNDFFIITCSEDLLGTLAIYDRWGRLVYNKTGYDNSFIGEDNNGNLLNEGGYIWIYEVNYGNGNKEVFNGTLTILR
ncbi:MAG: gliding motility-associated C-terminal domain-containing protein [Saprospiraceae bacterium]|nr:gliding motility-associated C-terminal domain-containing protein [Saprospiraceae bacterium]